MRAPTCIAINDSAGNRGCAALLYHTCRVHADPVHDMANITLCRVVLALLISPVFHHYLLDLAIVLDIEAVSLSLNAGMGYPSWYTHLMARLGTSV